MVCLFRSIGRSKGGQLVLRLLLLVEALLPSLDCKMNGGRQLRRRQLTRFGL